MLATVAVDVHEGVCRAVARRVDEDHVRLAVVVGVHEHHVEGYVGNAVARGVDHQAVAAAVAVGVGDEAIGATVARGVHAHGGHGLVGHAVARAVEQQQVQVAVAVAVEHRRLASQHARHARHDVSLRVLLDRTRGKQWHQRLPSHAPALAAREPRDDRCVHTLLAARDGARAASERTSWWHGSSGETSVGTCAGAPLFSDSRQR
eukprot:scaffold122741_cov60-Phaeocystis_antarctica.AAC.3